MRMFDSIVRCVFIDLNCFFFHYIEHVAMLQCSVNKRFSERSFVCGLKKVCRDKNLYLRKMKCMKFKVYIIDGLNTWKNLTASKGGTSTNRRLVGVNEKKEPKDYKLIKSQTVKRKLVIKKCMVGKP